MAKQTAFHADSAHVTVIVDGVPVSVVGEVDVVLKQPQKTNPVNSAAWDKVKSGQVQGFAAEFIEAAGG